MAEIRREDFNFPELVDLALCSPEVGAVNFNILRILLHEMLKKLGVEHDVVQLDDMQSHQIQNFKNYIQGAGTASPMPGVLRYNNPPGHLFTQKTPQSSRMLPAVSVSPSQAAFEAPQQGQYQSQRHDPSPTEESGGHRNSGAGGGSSGGGGGPSGGGGGTSGGGGAAHTSGSRTARSGRQPPPSAREKEIETKVARLERHLEALYALPTNQQILGDSDKTQGMSVNDMWQIIQLNNRIAAAEAAIQKMASLIEDLAKEMKVVKSDSSGVRKKSEAVAKTNSEMTLKMEPISEKCTEAIKAVDTLKGDLEMLKRSWRQEIDNLQKATGVDLNKMPSFMKVPGSGQDPRYGAPGQAQGQGSQRPPGQSAGVQVQPVYPAGQQPQGQSFITQITGQPGQQQAAPVGGAQPGQIYQGPPQGHVGQQQPPPGPYPPQQQGQPGQFQPQQQQQQGQAPQQIYQPGGGQPYAQGQGQGQQQGQPGQFVQPGQQQQQFGQPQQGQIQQQQVQQGQVQQQGQQPGQPQQKPQQQVQQPGQPQQTPAPVQQPGHTEQQQQQSGHTQQQPQQQRAEPQGTQDGQPQHQEPAGQSGAEDVHRPSQVAQTGPRPSTAGGGQSAAVQEKPSPVKTTEIAAPVQPAVVSSASKLTITPSATQSATVELEGQHYPGDSTFDGMPIKSNASHTESQDGRPPTRGEHQHGHGTKHGHISDAHPGTRHHKPGTHIPVDVTISGVQVGEEHPFSDYPQKPQPTAEEIAISNDIVQKELQAQYAKLQGMQRQMAGEIQDKMEFIYQKLLREIAAQHLTTSPYMALGAAADCLGPGVCTGHGMPAGTAVCEFPQAHPEKKEIPFHIGAGGVAVGGPQSGKSCPGPGVCPGAAFCPTCKSDALHHIKVPPTKGGLVEQPLDIEQDFRTGISAEMLKDVKSLILLPKDLEELRRQVKDKGKIPAIYDETEIIEKLATLWEAVTIIKGNEEAIAVRIVKQDAALKKVPPSVLDKLHKIPAENLEAIASATFDRPLIIPSPTSLNKNDINQLRGIDSATGGMRMGNTKDLVPYEDIQMIFNNLSNLLVENAATKERLEHILDTVHQLDNSVVTKPMLVDAMSDKADKGQMNTKVSYDEFGSSMEELNSRMQNLLLEVYQKNDSWKLITDHLADELAEKLDKIEIGPLRAYFRHHLQHLEEKVFILTQQMEEPDPAGTRKKLLKDYNCLSCDRHVNISGATNAPLLPVLGPILAGHGTASQRAYELHKLRAAKGRYDPEGRDLNLYDKRGAAGQPGRSSRTPSDTLNDSDVMHLVNRYVGGSHTTVTTSDRIASFKRPSTASPSFTEFKEDAARPKTSYYYEE